MIGRKVYCNGRRYTVVHVYSDGRCCMLLLHPEDGYNSLQEAPATMCALASECQSKPPVDIPAEEHSLRRWS